jgi:hypothetical protein
MVQDLSDRTFGVVEVFAIATCYKGKRQKAKGKRQKAKGKRQKAKGKRQKAKVKKNNFHYGLCG